MFCNERVHFHKKRIISLLCKPGSGCSKIRHLNELISGKNVNCSSKYISSSQVLC